MSLLDAYTGLMESVSWKHRTGVNSYNEPTYSDSTIDVIWFDDVRMVQTAQGEEIQQLAFIQTTAAIEQGDAIVRSGITWPIVGVQKVPTFDGEQFRIGSLGQNQV